MCHATCTYLILYLTCPRPQTSNHQPTCLLEDCSSCTSSNAWLSVVGSAYAGVDTNSIAVAAVAAARSSFPPISPDDEASALRMHDAKRAHQRRMYKRQVPLRCLHPQAANHTRQLVRVRTTFSFPAFHAPHNHGATPRVRCLRCAGGSAGGT